METVEGGGSPRFSIKDIALSIGSKLNECQILKDTIVAPQSPYLNNTRQERGDSLHYTLNFQSVFIQWWNSKTSKFGSGIWSRTFGHSDCWTRTQTTKPPITAQLLCLVPTHNHTHVECQCSTHGIVGGTFKILQIASL